MRVFGFATGFALTFGAAAFAQDAHDMGNMPGMEQGEPAPPSQSDNAYDMSSMPGMAHDMSDMRMTGILGSYPMTRDASGTSWQPDAATHGGVHFGHGEWRGMAHLRLYGVYDTQSGPRGANKAFLAGMAMVSVSRDYYGGDLLNLRAMLSPDPLMGKSGYPLLLATGETANGTTPLVDRQHPHDLFMELSASFTHYLSASDSVFVYAGYPGEPALGPPAFMHRASGMDIPSAPITHHWLDSTHIVFGVATVGYVHQNWKFEVSQFTGREPDQHRFDFDSARFDSTSARVTYNPTENWSFQVSWGAIKSPEQLEPDVDETRLTASAGYVTKLGDDGLFAATLAWGLKQESPGPDLNGVLFEAEYHPAELWTLFTRAEWEENAELDAHAGKATVGTLAFGAIRDFEIAEQWKIGIGAQYAFDFVPRSLEHDYGGDPHGAMVFVRLIAE